MRNEIEAILQVSHLYKNDEERKFLTDVTVSFSPKGIHGILGPKGAGKSALMDLLAGCATADEGTIFFLGQEISERDVKWKKEIGYVPRTPEFYGTMTVLETLDFVGEVRGVSADKRYRQMKEAISLMELEAVENRLTSRLSKWEKKRLALAAALLGNTSVLLVDDPLFFERRNENLSLLRMLGKHKTVIVASSDFALMKELCEDVVILSEGTVYAQDCWERLEENIRSSTSDQQETMSLENLYDSLVTLSKQRKKEIKKEEWL